MELKAEHICKKIRGAVILDDISLHLESGHVYGFAGRNGSGKTMLFRALSGLMHLDSGTVSLDGKILHRDFSVLPNLGIVLENAGLYPEYTGLQNLTMLANLNCKVNREEIKHAIRRVGLDPADRRTFRKYSLGMKQRIVIAQAIMERPEIIMLDEPTNALDSDGVEEIRQIITEEKERGALVLLASHNPDDMRLLADSVFYLEHGRILDEGGGRP